MITEMDFEADDPCPTIVWHKDFSDDEYSDAIEKLMSFCMSYGVGIHIDGNSTSEYQLWTNRIILNGRCGFERTYYELLHEIGHMVVHKDLKKKDDTAFLLHYPGYVGKELLYMTGDKKTKADLRRLNTAVIHTELDAWRKGTDIASLLSLPLGLYDYWEFASRQVETYLRDAVEEKLLT
ncbi:MAG TPA: hypothetical protein VMW36_00455 [Patescibacteria group bacterium]|nr:hypothetical protein [Patescibacteria group bacterium]